MSQDEVTIKPWSLSIRKAEKFCDPRILQIDLDAPLVDLSKHSQFSNGENRVMPINNLKKMLSVLKRKTKCFKKIDTSHFWVSGYYPLYFYLQRKGDRIKMKKMVSEAVKESGGFMTFDQWFEKHKSPTRDHGIMQFSGTGSGITCDFNTSHKNIAFR